MAFGGPRPVALAENMPREDDLVAESPYPKRWKGADTRYSQHPRERWQEKTLRINEPVTQKRVPVWEGANILSTTDAKGRIRYINDDFVRISGYQPDELIGQSHNVIRHPDMPRVVFEHMWRQLQAGHSWMGVIKNRCKNGDHYWVHAYATPIRNERGEITEIQSVRQRIEDESIIHRAEALYQSLRSREPDKGKIPEGLLPGTARAGWFGLAAGTALVIACLVALATLPLPTWAQVATAAVGVVGYAAGVWPVAHQLRAAQAEATSYLSDPLGEQVYLGARNPSATIQLALLHLATETQAISKRLGDDTHQLSRSAGQAREAMQTVRSEAQRQSDETRSVATAMEQMSATVEEVARNASHTSDATQRANQQTEHGRETVEKSREAVRRLVERIESAAALIERVDTEAERIGKASTLINKITKQTHLLALNASVESARAGEAGRSFTVVAEEVRKLASQTADSTREISEIIESLQAGSADAVAAMQESRSRAEQTLEHADDSGTALREIEQAVEEIRDMAGQIATATEQQGATAREIARSISSIEEVAGRVTEESHHTDDQMHRVIDRIDGITALTSGFIRRRDHRG